MAEWSPATPFDLGLCRLSAEANEAGEAMEASLSASELLRLYELRRESVDKRARQWLLGRIAAKRACRRWFEARGETAPEDQAIAIINDEHGAPRLRLEGDEARLSLSISHSGDEALAVVAEGPLALGVDLERRRELRSSPLSMARRICAEAEFQRWFDGLEGAQVAERLLQLWVMKEAAAKATGLGFQGRPQAFVVAELDALTGLVEHQGRSFEARLHADDERMMALAWGLWGR